MKKQQDSLQLQEEESLFLKINNVAYFVIQKNFNKTLNNLRFGKREEKEKKFF